MRKSIIFLFLILSFAGNYLSASDKKIIYEGTYAVFEGGRIILFYDEHVLEVTSKEHSSDCPCLKDMFK